MENLCRKCAPKASLKNTISILVNKTAIACKKFFQKQDILKKDYQKALRMLILFYLSNPVSFNRQDYEKQKEPGTSNKLLYRLQTSSKNTFLVMFYLTNVDVLLYNGFCVILKLMSANFQAFTNCLRAYVTYSK